MTPNNIIKYRIRQNGLKFQPESFTEVLDMGIFGTLPPQVRPVGEPLSSLAEAKRALDQHVKDVEFNQTVYHDYP
jgi:hypothetical protein